MLNRIARRLYEGVSPILLMMVVLHTVMEKVFRMSFPIEHIYGQQKG